MTDRPLIRLNPGQDRRLRAGHPWAYSNEIRMSPEYRAMEKGLPVRLESAEGWRYGTFMFNPHSLIAARLLDRDPDAAIDEAWLRRRLDDAIALRARLGLGRFHRVVHAEADRLPGLVVDRHDDVIVVQANTAGMDRLLPLVARALREALGPRAIVARNDSAARLQEGLPQETVLLHGQDARVEVEEGGVRFAVDPIGGQKTGWFYDQRPNRAMLAALARGGRVLDVFSHTGAFGLQCAAAGAAAVTLVDASAPALDLAAEAARRNGFPERVATRRGDAFEVMAALAGEGMRYEIVIVDPPAFAKTKKDRDAGLRAYGRLARLAAPLVAPGGFLFAASCSHHAPLPDFAAAVAEGITRARREGRILATTGAGPDHPVHPLLPETAYLKGQLIQLV
jgi:23S rRNA (cytosine1962-C5)-methyltransferase